MDKKVLIVGCGISSATLANKLANAGWKVLIYEKNNFVGGNCYDSYDKSGVLIHNFGPHIFHTNFEDVYQFITQFTKLNIYVNKVLVNVDNKLFPLPINFKSIEIIMPDKAKELIALLKEKFPGQTAITLFDLRKLDNELIKQFLDYISKNVYFNYSSKMWGVKFEDIDPNTISRVKIVLGYDHNYFPQDKYQGIPINGYTDMIKKMLDHKNIKVCLNTNALDHLSFDDNEIKLDNKPVDYPVIYCGSLDEAINYKYGMLPYRSLNIKFETVNKTHFQTTGVVNYPADPTMTRITEYKWMTFQDIEGVTTISKEYPGQFDINSSIFKDRYYPIANPANAALYEKYKQYFARYQNFYALGRLSQYKYFDMDDSIKVAIDLANTLINKEK